MGNASLAERLFVFLSLPGDSSRVSFYFFFIWDSLSPVYVKGINRAPLGGKAYSWT